MTVIFSSPPSTAQLGTSSIRFVYALQPRTSHDDNVYSRNDSFDGLHASELSDGRWQ